MTSAAERTRYLVCEPAGFGAHHLLNPWMRWSESVDSALAVRQWTELATALSRAGADLEVMDNRSRSSAMTFARDTAVVTARGAAIVLRNAGRRGDLEPAVVRRWLETNGYEVDELPASVRVDGGNVLPTSDGWVVGLPPGCDRRQATDVAVRLRDLTGARVHGVPIRDPRHAHLDTAFADLGGAGWLAYPAAFLQPDLDAPAWRSVLAGRRVIEVEPHEAASLACNVVVVDGHVIGDLTPRLCRLVARLGLEPMPVPLGEFRKAGGGAHCLTLELDPVHVAAHHDPDPPAADPDERRQACLAR